ncbi:uncharacterized protein PFL1_04183 [Pseudozyma flocculosa PF-1]|nr:uncharacterized protein PFL1_04183 [Pseudozyma flocculosa PF-1]EPQ28356.1 hypothetical protein PFL1_04183 [Pseudozyma flocculosa PF-1]
MVEDEFHTPPSTPLHLSPSSSSSSSSSASSTQSDKLDATALNRARKKFKHRKDKDDDDARGQERKESDKGRGGMTTDNVTYGLAIVNSIGTIPGLIMTLINTNKYSGNPKVDP